MTGALNATSLEIAKCIGNWTFYIGHSAVLLLIFSPSYLLTFCLIAPHTPGLINLTPTEDALGMQKDYVLQDGDIAEFHL